MNITTDCTLVRLDRSCDLTDFCCDHIDLDDFIRNDAIGYQDNLFSVTYLFVLNDNPKEIVAFFSVANDNLRNEGFEKNIWKKFTKAKFEHPKRRRNYPSVLLGRLGVSKKYKGDGVGTQILNFVKGWFRFANKTGCRFILVDAYNEEKVLKFYTKNGFLPLLERDEKDKTRFMLFDLKSFGEN